MLRVDIRDLERGPVDTVGRIAPDDAVLDGLELPLNGPVSVEGTLQMTGEGEFFWRGEVHADFKGECRRCLAALSVPFDTDVTALFSTDPDAADDASVYLLPPHASHVDVTDAVREELALAAPMFALCRDDCAGLCPRCGADLNAGPCACAVHAEHV